MVARSRPSGSSGRRGYDPGSQYSATHDAQGDARSSASAQDAAASGTQSAVQVAAFLVRARVEPAVQAPLQRGCLRGGVVAGVQPEGVLPQSLVDLTRRCHGDVLERADAGVHVRDRGQAFGQAYA